MTVAVAIYQLDQETKEIDKYLAEYLGEYEEEAYPIVGIQIEVENPK
ncbi:hypothetical protein QUB63_32500 [Microcoleus sp. ARI1-B5]